MVSLVATGTGRVEEIAAVTFTRKAAGELRERFQETLEETRTRAAPGSGERERLERALQGSDRAFMGTIHAFCARLLRERPLEAAIDPGFRETTAREADQVAEGFWAVHLERLATEGSSAFQELAEVGLRPAELRELYHRLRDYPDVSFPTPAVPAPVGSEILATRRAVSELLEEGRSLLPTNEPTDGWDDLQRRILTLLYLRREGRWQDDRVFLNALADFCAVKEHKVTQKRWSEDRAGKRAAAQFAERCNRIGWEGPAARTVRIWQAHRYPVALRFTLEAASALSQHRLRSGQLDFQDLLFHAARLLREWPRARRDLGRRYRRLLVDEFQDTDPLQAEIVFLLASEPDEPAGQTADWRTVVPRPGALFVVGDPKQSIYRFRRADIFLYGKVAERFRAFGDVLRLEANFRSSEPLATLINTAFSGPGGFPAEPTQEQAQYAPLRPQHSNVGATDGAYTYTVRSSRSVQSEVADWDAAALATWILGRVEAGERTPGDFLILTRTRHHLERYARELEARNLAVQVSGAGVGVEHELGELKLLLEALSDPGDAAKTVAVLIGLFFGLDHRQLLEHRLGRGGVGRKPGRSIGIRSRRRAHRGAGRRHLTQRGRAGHGRRARGGGRGVAARARPSGSGTAHEPA